MPWQLLPPLACAAALVCACGGGSGGAAKRPATRSGSTVTTAQPGVGGVSPESAAGQPIEPSAFSSGACVAFAPIASARHLTVFLDAGHGGRDAGTVGSTESGRTIYEADGTLAVELEAAAILRAAGFRVVVSRTSDTSVLRLGPDDASGGVLRVEGSHEDVLAGDVCADEAHANVLVGIYFNAEGPSGAGCLTAYDAGGFALERSHGPLEEPCAAAARRDRLPRT